ncbi:MAG: methyltransferase [Bacteroidales bacterium]
MRTVLKLDKSACCVFNNSINREIASLNGVYGVNVDNYRNEVTVDHTNEVTVNEITDKLEKNGYKVLPTEPDYFHNKADNWDTPMKLEMADNFIMEMFKSISFNKDQKVLDFGCGTGLAGLRIAPLVKSIVFMDISRKMLDVLATKIGGDDENYKGINGKATIINGGIEKYTTDDIDVIFSLMALHHIEDTQAVFEHISTILKPGGFLVIGDLKEEDGSFHGDERVPHNGFDVDTLASQVENSDMEIILADTYNTLNKNGKEYDQFILIARNLKSK